MCFNEVDLLIPNIGEVGLHISDIGKVEGVGGLNCILYWSGLLLPS